MLFKFSVIWHGKFFLLLAPNGRVIHFNNILFMYVLIVEETGANCNTGKL